MSKNLSYLTKDAFDAFVGDDKVTVVDFWASWCGPCKMLGPIFEEAAAEMDGKANFGKVNVDEEEELSERFEIMSIPTLKFFKSGKLLETKVGLLPKQSIIDIINSL